MPFPNDLETVVDPLTTDPLSNPSHATDEHSKINGLVVKLQKMFVSRSGTERHFLNIREFCAGDGTDQAAGFTALRDAASKKGCVILCPPGIYASSAQTTWTNYGSLFFWGLSGIRMATSTAQNSNEHGVIFRGLTSGMTMHRFERTAAQPTTSDATMSGPQFHRIGFEDGLAKHNTKTITAATAAGTTATFTVGASHGFLAGDSIYVKDTFPADGGTQYNGVFTVSSVGATTVVATLASAPTGPATTFGSMRFDTMRPAPTMTGLHIVSQTRWALEDCSFWGLHRGVNVDPGSNDASWGRIVDIHAKVCNEAVRLTGANPQSIRIEGGDIEVGSNQTGIAGYSPASMCRIRDLKFDLGQESSGQGAVGIRLRQSDQFHISGNSFECDVRAGQAYCVRIGEDGSAYGDIVGNMMKGKTESGVRYTDGIYVNGTGASDVVHSTNIIGGTFNALQRCVRVGQFSKGVTVVAGGHAFCTTGVQIDAGATDTKVIGPAHGADNAAYTAIVDSGTGTQVLFVTDPVNGRSGELVMQGQSSSAVATPTAGKRAVFVDSGSGALSIKRSDGAVVSLEEAGGGGGGTTTQVVAQQTGTPVSITAIGDNYFVGYTIPANTAVVGDMYEVETWGVISTDATAQPSLNFRLDLAGTPISSCNFTPDVSLTSGRGFYHKVTATLSALPGSTATWQTTGTIMTSAPASAGNRVQADSASTTKTMNTDRQIRGMVTLSAALPAGDAFTITQAVIRKVN